MIFIFLNFFYFKKKEHILQFCKAECIHKQIKNWHIKQSNNRLGEKKPKLKCDPIHINCRGTKELLLSCHINKKSFTRKFQLDHHRAVHKKIHYVCSSCSVKYSRKSFYLPNVKKYKNSMSSQPNEIIKSIKRKPELETD